MRIIYILILISAIHGTFLIAIMLIHNKKRINENHFLILLLTIITGYLFREFLYLEGHFVTFPHLMAVFVPFLYLLGPIYYFYIKSAVYQEVKLKKVDLLHLVPAIICFFIILPFYVKSGSEKLAMFDPPGPGDLELAPNRIFFYGLILISGFLYCRQSALLINKASDLQDGRPNKSIQTKLKWLRYYTRTFLYFLTLFLIAQLIFIFTDFYQYYVMLYTVLAASILIHVVSYWAVKESSIANTEEKNIRKSLLPESKINDLKNQIISILENEKIYLKSDLTINDFCERLSTNAKYISHLINSEFNCSLTYLINSYRIEASKKMILSHEYDHLNFLGIANEVGFNTKNTFTRTFKRHTGKTPSQFKIEAVSK